MNRVQSLLTIFVLGLGPEPALTKKKKFGEFVGWQKFWCPKNFFFNLLTAPLLHFRSKFPGIKKGRIKKKLKCKKAEIWKGDIKKASDGFELIRILNSLDPWIKSIFPLKWVSWTHFLSKNQQIHFAKLFCLFILYLQTYFFEEGWYNSIQQIVGVFAG